MQYKVQYLDGSNSVVWESSADTAVMSKFISDKNWPDAAVQVRVLTEKGRRVLSLTKPTLLTQSTPKIFPGGNDGNDQRELPVVSRSAERG